MFLKHNNLRLKLQMISFVHKQMFIFCNHDPTMSLPMSLPMSCKCHTLKQPDDGCHMYSQAWVFPFVLCLFEMFCKSKIFKIAAKFAGSIGILPCCVLNDFFT